MRAGKDDMSETKRTKEQLIHAQQREEQQDVDDILGAMLGATVVDLAAGCAMDSLDALSRAAGWYWQRVTFLGFDLRRVDEQGRMLEAGEIETRPHEPGKGREVVTWEAGEHLDDVITYSVEQVTERARQALAAWGRQEADRCQQLLHKAEVVLRDLDVKPIGAGAPPARFDVYAALAAGTYDETRKVLRGMGLDLMPLLRWEDVRAWLLSIGCKVEERQRLGDVLISRGDHMICVLWPSEADDMIAQIGKMLDMPVRAVREAILRHVEQSREPGAKENAGGACGPVGRAADKGRTGVVGPARAISPAVAAVRAFMNEHDRGVLWTSPYLFDIQDLENIIAADLRSNPDLRVVLVCGMDGHAKKAVDSVSRLLGDLATKSGTNRLAMRERPAPSHDPSFLCTSIDHVMSGGLTGARIDRLYLFEAIHPTWAHRPEKHRQMAQCFSAEMLGRLTPGSRVYVIGQPWHEQDLACSLTSPKRGGAWPALFEPLAAPGDGKSRWPEEYPAERIASMRERLGPQEAARQIDCRLP